MRAFNNQQAIELEYHVSSHLGFALAMAYPYTHRWNECATCHLEAGKRAYYAFENTCNLRDIKCWVLKKYLFNTLVTPVLLYGVVV